MSTPDNATPQRATRADRAVNGALLGVITLVIATSALTARPPAPPQIAQFAPQAQHHITRAQSRLSGDFGSPGGGPGGVGGSPSPKPSVAPRIPPPVLPPPPAKSHNCFGDPPAQIATDTQSPPCIPYWVGKNPGSTYRGVTASTVRIAVPQNLNGPSPRDPRLLDDLEAFFNKYFEFYGRKLEITLEGNATNCQPMVAFADTLAKKGYFAVADPNTRSDDCFDNAAARNKMVVVGRIQSAIPDLTSKKLKQLAPYVWSYERPADLQFADLGHFLCSQWAGRKAEYAPLQSGYASQQRKFGFMFSYQQNLWSSQPSVDALKKAMRRCGATFAVEATYDAIAAGDTVAADMQTWANNTMAQMASEGVTTVVNVCSDWITCPVHANAASSNAYYPEFLMANSGIYYNWTAQTGWPAKDERQSLVLLSHTPAQVPYPNVPLNRALADVDPGFQVNDGLNIWKQGAIYQQLLLLASGIQMAGPNLTPHTFEKGLQLAHFPNPASPALQGIAQFGPDGYGMTTDFSVQWWSDTAPSVNADEGAGTWCYAQGGRRFTGEYFMRKRPQVLPPGPLSSARCYTSPPGS